MNANLIRPLHRISTAPMFSPLDLLARAALITLLFSAAHLAGWREYTSVLSGTSGNLGITPRLAGALGAAYVMLHFAFILVAPVLTLAAVFVAAWERRRQRRSRQGWNGPDQDVESPAPRA